MTLVHNLLRHRYALLLPCAVLAGTTFLSPRHAQAAHSLITQFQGCPADGQTGPVAAPTVLPTPFALAAPLPAGLTLYASQDLAAVGPVGWHCLQLYGSSGTFLMLRPEAFPSQTGPRLKPKPTAPVFSFPPHLEQPVAVLTWHAPLPAPFPTIRRMCSQSFKKG